MYLSDIFRKPALGCIEVDVCKHSEETSQGRQDAPTHVCVTPQAKRQRFAGMDSLIVAKALSSRKSQEIQN